MDLADSPLRNPQSWGALIAGWTVTLWAVLSTDIMVTADLLELRPPVVAVTFAFFVALTSACAAVLARIYLRLPGGWLEGRRALATVFACSGAASAVWTLLGGLVLVVVCRAPAREVWLSWAGVRAGVLGVAMFSAWSGAFLSFVFMDRVRRARERELRNEALTHEAQLRSLRAQVNPHFLFNAINSVVALVRIDPDRAERMLLDVGDLLRRSLALTQTGASTLGEELDFLRQYLRCEQERFPGTLSTHVEVPPELHHEPMPAMLLQPLVENAIKHGMIGLEPMRIDVTAKRRERALAIEVRNSGSLRAAFDSEPEDRAPGTGSGLRIVRERLRARYPRTGSFELIEESGWVVARLVLDPREELTVSAR